MFWKKVGLVIFLINILVKEILCNNLGLVRIICCIKLLLVDFFRNVVFLVWEIVIFFLFIRYVNIILFVVCCICLCLVIWDIFCYNMKDFSLFKVFKLILVFLLLNVNLCNSVLFVGFFGDRFFMVFCFFLGF